MKKLAIISSAAALAAMPLVGVFAADTTTVTDTINVTVSESCTFSNTTENTYEKTVSAGSLNYITGTTLYLSCNNDAGWYVQMVGGDGETASSDMAGQNTENTIPSVNEEGTSETGSYWGVRFSGKNGVTFKSPYNTESLGVIPETATTIATGDSPTSTAMITPSYGVKVSSTQVADTYEGKVTYTLVAGAEVTD